MSKKIVCMFLALLMLCSFAGCKSDSSSSATSQETSKLTVAFLTFSGAPKDLTEVQTALNKITKEKINAEVTLVPISFSSYGTQTNLMLTSKEKLDLFVTGNFGNLLTYSAQAPQGKLYALDSLLDQYGKDIKSSIGDTYLNTTKVGGKIYAVPALNDEAQSMDFFMRKDLADKYGIDASSINSFADIENVLKTVKEKDSTVYPYGFSAGADLFNAACDDKFDNLNDNIGVLLDSSKLTISNLYESALYKDSCETARRWYKSGYIYPDIGSQSAENLVKAGKIFSYCNAGKPGVVAQEQGSAGYELIDVKLRNQTTNTQSVTNFMWSIPSYSKESTAAMKFLNLMYSDKDVINTIDYGIEGKHYVKVEGKENIIDYPEGVTAQTTGYGLNMSWLFGNSFLSYIWNGSDPTINDQMKEFNENAVFSKATGFSFDVSSVKTEYAAVSTVVNQYDATLQSGQVDPAEKLPKFIAALKSAGIDKVIAAKQSALDEWAKTNNVN